MIKKLPLLLLLLLPAWKVRAQQTIVHALFDKLVFENTATAGWPVVTGNNVALNGYANLSYPNSGIVDFSNTPLKGTALNVIGLNKAGYLYDISFVAENRYKITSFNTQNNYSAQIIASDLDFDGSAIIDDDPRALGVDNEDMAWVVGYSVIDGNNYLSSFKTNSGGGISNLNNQPVIIKGDLSSFQVADIAFDLLNNMYLLINDLVEGSYYIYFIQAKVLRQQTSDHTVVMEKKWKLTGENDAVVKANNSYYIWNGFPFNTYDSYNCDGLFFDALGNLVVGVDKMTVSYSSTGLKVHAENYFYKFSYPDNLAVLTKNMTLYNTTQNKLSAPVSFIGDAATNNFLPFLPLTLGSLESSLSNNILQVHWTTKTEKNNLRFEVQASTDGRTFKTLGTVATKAVNGNSGDELSYDYNTTLTNNSFSGLLFPLVCLLFTGSFVKKRRNYLFVLAFFLAMAACKKSSPGYEEKKYDKVFIRLAYFDKDGKTNYSKIISPNTN